VGRESSTGLGLPVTRDKVVACPSLSARRGRNGGARTGLGLTAAAASLGLCCLGGAFTPAAAFPYPESTPYSAISAAPRPAKARDAAVAVVRPSHKRGGKSAEAAKPEPPKQPAGPLILAVSIGSQHVTVYDNGTPIASAPISSGMAGHLTPMGVFSVIQKDRWHHSNLYSNAPMPFMQRITWSGVALHAGVLPGYPASHGCIRLPESFAVRLWGMTRIGARVVVTRNDVAPYEIVHPSLAALVKKPDPPPAPDLPRPAPEARAEVTRNADASAVGTVVVALTAPSTDVTTDGTGVEDNLHYGAEHGITFASTASPAPVGRVAAADKPAGLRPALDTSASELVPVPHAKPADTALHPGPLSMFVSRKEGKLFVRRGFEPVFDAPIAIAHRELPLGTHVFTASRPTDGSDGVRWLAVSIGHDRSEAEPVRVKGKARAQEKPATPSSEAMRKAAAEALDRIELPPDLLERIGPLAPGASLLVSDQGLGGETGKETDFIVVTR
jgi:lipoprotein-anchoring transpeptidase ErfK/SrfK